MSLAIQQVVDPADIPAPIRVYESIKIADATNANESFSIMLGLNRNHVEQLKRYSLDVSDSAIQENTSDRRRFGEGSYEEWYEGNRVPFALVSETGVIATLAWFGPKEPPLKNSSIGAPWHTAAYRAYPPYRGTGIMGDFSRFALEYYRTMYPGIRLWAEVKEGNTASVALAKKLGFTEEACLKDRECGIILIEKHTS